MLMPTDFKAMADAYFQFVWELGWVCLQSPGAEIWHYFRVNFVS